MKNVQAKKYEAILLNSILKEGSKWTLSENERLTGHNFDVYRYTYHISFSNCTDASAVIEYDAKEHTYQVVYLSHWNWGKHGCNRSFRYLRYLDNSDFVDYLILH